jgi:hypothetical protein
MYSFQDTHHCQMAQAIEWSNHVSLVVTVGNQSGLHPFKGRWLCTTWHLLEQALTFWHQPLS